VTASAIAVTASWDLYRLSQQSPWPQDPEAAGALMRSQSRLFRLLEPHTRTLGKEGVPDLGAVGTAAGELAAALERANGGAP
jgi:hypothetical protein